MHLKTMLRCHSAVLPPLSPFRRHLPSQALHSLRSVSSGRNAAVRAAGLRQWLAELPGAAVDPPPEAAVDPPPEAAEDGGGPIKISPYSTSPIFASGDDPSTLQVATSVLLTGAISVFLFRSLRRRAKRAKELKVRSTGLTKPKDIKAEALDSLKAIGVASVEAGAPPSPLQALLGSIAAGVIALILYKFAVTVEASLNRQTISDNFSVRQITVTIRTIVNGLCYLATFIFGINSIGLLLYSIQLLFGSLEGNSNGNPLSSIKEEGGRDDARDPTMSSPGTVESKGNGMQETSDDT